MRKEVRMDGCMDHDTIEWEVPFCFEGCKVRIVFENNESDYLFGEITMAEDNRLHIALEEN